jgi:hypothetical protein
MASIKVTLTKIYINGQPYDKDSLRPIYNHNRRAVRIVHPYYDNFRDVLEETRITDIINGNTNLPFTGNVEMDNTIKLFYSTTV